jgi:formate hydrogenlyase subunit 3/multisubunit Na+/H+ antiporter MnhD subunit
MIFMIFTCAGFAPSRPAGWLESPRRAPISMPRSIAMDVSRFLITLGLAILVIGLLWPVLGKIGPGRMPGDIVIRRDNFTLYFPIVTCLLVSAVLSLILWLANR